MDAKDECQAKLAKLGFRLGVYRHYKGGLYVVYSTSLDEELLHALVHYYSLEKKTRWTRFLDVFTEEVDVPDGKVARFVYERGMTPSELHDAIGVMDFPMVPGVGP
jgi:hypothetical protein